MRADTITRAQAQLPATREEMEQRLDLKPGSCRHVVRHMLSKGYALARAIVAANYAEQHATQRRAA